MNRHARDGCAFVGSLGACALITAAALSGSIVFAYLAVGVFVAGVYLEGRV